MRSKVVLSLLIALLPTLVHGGPAQPSNDGCRDGDVRSVGGATKDAAVSVEMCENELWKKVVLCSETERRTIAAVACRELGYPAGDAYRGRQVTEPSRRLSYTPQCVGSERTLSDCPRCVESENRLRDCSTTDGSDSCSAPLLIMCYPNRTVIGQQSSTMTSPTLPSSLSLPSQLVSRPSPSSYTSLLKLHPSTTRQQSTFSTLTPVANAVHPSSLPPPTTRFPSLSLLSPEVVIGAIGGVVVLLGAVILTFVVIFVCRRQQRVKPSPTSPHPYEVPEPSRQSNDSHQETEPHLAEMTASSQPSLDSVQYHTPNHFPASGTSPSLHIAEHQYYVLERPREDITEHQYSRVLQRSREDIAEHQYNVLQRPREDITKHQYNVLQRPREDIAEHQYSVLQRSREDITKHQYNVLQRPREDITKHQYNVLQRPREDIAEHQYSVLQRPREDIAEHQYNVLQRPREDIAEHQYNVLQRPREDIAEHQYNVLQRPREDIAEHQYNVLQRPREDIAEHQLQGSTENSQHQYAMLQISRGNIEMNRNNFSEGADENVNENNAVETSTGKETKNGYDILKPANSGSDPMNFVVASLQQEAKPATSGNDPMNFVVVSLQQEESCSQPPTPSSGCSNNSLTTLL